MGLRPGTLPVPLVVGFGTAAELADREQWTRRAEALKVGKQFLAGLAAVEHRHNGDQQRIQSHVVNIMFPGVDSEALMLALGEIVAISNGAACTSASYSPSHVLKAMGLSDDEVSWSIRISWGLGVSSIPADVFVQAVRELKA